MVRLKLCLNICQNLLSVGRAIARDCNCHTGCAKCLIQHGCPDGNTALLKQMGLVLLDAVARPET